jgi:transposase-like protein
MKRAILIQLSKEPTASAAEICRALDADGGEELTRQWKRQASDRSFSDAYSDAGTRTKIETMISKVRLDMRKHGLLPLR